MTEVEKLQFRISELESRGYSLPTYVYNITREETAKRWGITELIEVSKAIDPRTGKEVSGRVLQELERSKSAKQGAQKRKEKFRLSWNKEKERLTRLTSSLLDTFQNDKLRKMIQSLFLKRSVDDNFWRYVFLHEEETVDLLQRHAQIPYNAPDSEVKAAYEEWITFLNYGEIPNIEIRKKISETIDRDEDQGDDEENYPSYYRGYVTEEEDEEGEIYDGQEDLEVETLQQELERKYRNMLKDLPEMTDEELDNWEGF